ncbi:MAG: class I SAM-dependent methyltransferase [Alphaproteobacteria bacterium]|nr:class I SAM-dependent methyltransferase [Alphaproteobacteria bacterium]
MSFRLLPRLILNRPWTQRDRRDHRPEMAQRWLSGAGLEIGALHKPTPVSPDASVAYVDYKTRQENERTYPELAAETIVETHHVGDGFVLDFIPDGSQDFLIANHALEHSPNPWGTLEVWWSKLKPAGTLYVTVPVAEKCFDKGRPISRLADMLQDRRNFLALDREAAAQATERRFREFVTISDANIRRDNTMPPADPVGQAAFVEARMAALRQELQQASSPAAMMTAHITTINRVYDIHYHTFTPASFLRLGHAFCLSQGGRVADIRKSGGGEVIMILRKLPHRPKFGRV